MNYYYYLPKNEPTMGRIDGTRPPTQNAPSLPLILGESPHCGLRVCGQRSVLTLPLPEISRNFWYFSVVSPGQQGGWRLEIGPKASAAAQWRTECAISPGTPHIIRTAVRHCLRTSRAAIVSPSAQPFAALLPFSLSSGENDIMEKQATHRGAGVSGGDRGGGQPRRRRRDAGLRLGPAGLNVCRPLARMMFVAVQPCRLALDVASACCSR
jgi:hypothetical protein